MAQVIDEFGKVIEKKKKKIGPIIPPVINKPEITPVVATPFVSANDAAKAGTATTLDGRKLGTFEEGVTQRAKDAETKVVLKDEGFTGSEVVPDVVAEQGPTSGDVKGQLAAVARQRKLAQFKNAFDIATGTEQRNLDALPGQFRGLQTQVRTEGDLAKTAAGKISAIGATGSGSLAQTNLGQDVITRGQSGELLQQEQQAKTDIRNRLADLQREFELGKADINMQAEADNLTARLEEITAKEQAELKAIEIQDARDYDLFLRELDKFDEKEMAIFENELETENTLLDEQIQIAQDDRDFKTSRALQGQKDANAIKLQGIRDANAAARVVSKGEVDRETAEFKSGLEAEEDAADIEDRFDDGVFEDGAKALLDSFGKYADESEKKVALTNYLFNQIVSGNLSTDEQVSRLEARFNLSPGTIERKLNAIEGSENRKEGFEGIEGTEGLNLPN